MKRNIVLLAFLLMALSIPLKAQAQDKSDIYSLLEEQATSGDPLRAARQYSYALIIPYTVHDGQFASGLAVFNYSPDVNTFLIGSYDTAGNLVASGSFSLLPGSSMVSMINGLMDEGSDPLPAQGFTALFADGPFVVDRFIFQAGGGFGEITLDSEPY